MALRSILRSIPLFKNLSSDDLSTVAARLKKEHHLKGSILFYEGDLGDAMFLVESGQLAVVDARAESDEAPIALIGPGNFVGELSLILAQPRTATVKVVIDAQLWVLGKSDFDTLIATRPGMALEMIRELGRRLVTTTRKKRQSAQRRVTALCGGHKGLDLSAAIQTQLQSSVALLPLPNAVISQSAELPLGVMILDSQHLTEAELAEGLSHQVEVFKHVVLVLPDTPHPVAQKAAELADTIVSVGAPPVWLNVSADDDKVWAIADSADDLMRVVRRLTNCTVGLALSSGGTRGLAHVGVLKVLAEENIPIDMIAGSSAGALFGAFFAAGWSPEKIEDYAHYLKTLTNLPNWDFKLPPRTGIVKGRKARDKYLAEPLKNATFADLALPFFAVAGDILTGDEVVFSSGPVADAIRASASIPILGEPWQYQGRYLIDGGIVNPLPANVLRRHGADIIIGSSVIQPLGQSYSGPTNKMPNIWQTVFNIFSAMEAEVVQKQLPFIDVLIQNNVSARSTLDFDNFDQLIASGEKAARQMMPEIKKALASPPED